LVVKQIQALALVLLTVLTAQDPVEVELRTQHQQTDLQEHMAAAAVTVL
jgi:hypothetical protein